MFKAILVLILALAVALYFPTSRAFLAEKAAPVVNPWLVRATENELRKIAAEMRRLEINNLGRIPDRRSLGSWIERNYAGDASIDPWGSPYEMRETRRQVVLISLGPDRRRDTQDDIRVTVDVPGRR